jgi:hypothetical protein
MVPQQFVGRSPKRGRRIKVRNNRERKCWGRCQTQSHWRRRTAIIGRHSANPARGNTPTGTFDAVRNYIAGANELSAFPNASVVGRRANPKFADVLCMETPKCPDDTATAAQSRIPA